MSNGDIFFYESKQKHDIIARAYHVFLPYEIVETASGVYHRVICDVSYSKFESKPTSGRFEFVPPVMESLGGNEYYGSYAILIQFSGYKKIRIDSYGVPSTYETNPYRIYFFNKEAATKPEITGPSFLYSDLLTEYDIPENSDGRILIPSRPGDIIQNVNKPYIIQLL